MKAKLKLFLFILSISFLSACTDNSNPIVNVSADDLIGVWNVTSMEAEGTSTTTLAGQTLTSNFTNTGRDYDFTVKFTSDPNIVNGTGSYISVNTINVAGQTITEEILVNSIPGFDSGTWSLDGNIITTTVGGQSNEAIIDEISDNLLVLKAAIDETQVLQGISVHIVGNLTLTLRR